MSGHTPGKLEAVLSDGGGCHWIKAASGAPAAVAEVSDMGGEGEANALRLCACWNALEGIENIGSTGYVALKHERKFVGIELKRAYWRQAVKNIRQAQRQLGLFAEGEPA